MLFCIFVWFHRENSVVCCICAKVSTWSRVGGTWWVSDCICLGPIRPRSHSGSSPHILQAWQCDLGPKVWGGGESFGKLCSSIFRRIDKLVTRFPCYSFWLECGFVWHNWPIKIVDLYFVWPNWPIWPLIPMVSLVKITTVYPQLSATWVTDTVSCFPTP